MVLKSIEHTVQYLDSRMYKTIQYYFMKSIIFVLNEKTRADKLENYCAVSLTSYS